MKSSRANRLIFVLAALLAAPGAQASFMSYTDRASFEAVLSDSLIDTFDGLPDFINSAALVNAASVASISYASTFHSVPDWNINSAGRSALCWGCNGSGSMTFDNTALGNSNGVFGFGLDILSNRDTIAFATFADGSSANIALDNGAGFLGLTSSALIQEIHFGGLDGTATSSIYFEFDNATIGNAAIGGANVVSSPASLGLLVLGLVGLQRIRAKNLPKAA